MEVLRKQLKAIDGKSYKAYKALTGEYHFPDYTLSIDHVQGDPFATPSRISIRIPVNDTALPTELWNSKTRRVACEDYIARAVAEAIKRRVKGNRGSGKSGEVIIATSGQQVLLRNALLLESDYLEARLTIGLPADLRRINSEQAEAMLFTELPAVVSESLFYRSLDADSLKQHVESVEDQQFLRDWLDKAGLVAFVADNSILPRHSGVDDRPLQSMVIPFKAPASLAVKVDLPNSGRVRGLGIRNGVTLIVGGGFHGKSTLLHALEYGIYDHIPGDGREQVVTNKRTVKIRAEDGRAISGVDINPFINNLPLKQDTHCFSTENASGSTSQAANIIEALQAEAKVLLIDEDTSATNFMIRDERMQQLVHDDKEPITPFLSRVRELYEVYNISSVIVMGGSGDYFAIADTVIMMDNYIPQDVTEKARQLANHESIKATFKLPEFEIETARRPDKKVVDGSRGKHKLKFDSRFRGELYYGIHHIDVTGLEQLVNEDQTRTLGWLLNYYAMKFSGNKQGLLDNLKQLYDMLDKEGLDILTPYKVGDLVCPRLQELAATINRIREGNWII